MNRVCLTIAILLVTMTLAAQPAKWSALQHELGLQAAEFKNSPDHLELRSRDARDYSVGDPKTFWRWNLSVMPPTWVQTAATCRAVGEHCYIFVANDQWNLNMTQADVDSALVRLEERTANDPTQGAIEMDIELFGPIPNELDNDPRVIVFYSALGSFQGNYFDGYFSPYNQVTEAQAQQMNPSGHSNECEMIYMTCYPLDPSAPIRFSVLAHELQHLIHWGQDANEEQWINEGCSELAMVAYGVPDPITGFPSNPDNNLTVWNQSFADYVKVMLFFSYLQEHYDATGLISDLVSDPQNGIVSMTTQIANHFPGQSFADVFSNWGVANVADGDSLQNELWGYSQLDLPNFGMTNLPANPQLDNQTIQPYATDYLRYTCQIQGDQQINLICNATLRLKAVFFDYAGNCQNVEDYGLNNAFSVVPPSSSLYNSVVYVLSNPFSNQLTYSVSTPVHNDDNLCSELADFKLNLFPNPCNFSSSILNIEYELKEYANVRLEIFNAKGQKVKTLVNCFQPQGEHAINWNGRDDRGMQTAQGIYFYRFTAGNKQLSRKFVLLSVD